MKKGCCHNEVSLLLRMDYFPLIFSPECLLFLPDLVSEYLVFYRTQHHFGSRLCTRVDVTGWKWLQWVSDPARGKFLCEPVNHFQKNSSPSHWESHVHPCSHVWLWRKWIKSCCLAGWLSAWTSLTGWVCPPQFRSLQNDLGLDACASVFVFRRCIVQLF